MRKKLPMDYREALADQLESRRISFNEGSCLTLLKLSKDLYRFTEVPWSASRQVWHKLFAPTRYSTGYWLDDHFPSGPKGLKEQAEWRKTAFCFFIHMLRDKDYDIYY